VKNDPRGDPRQISLKPPSPATCGICQQCGFSSVLSYSDHLPQPQRAKTDHLTKSPDPLCGAVFTARRGACDPRALSCFIFVPAVLGCVVVLHIGGESDQTCRAEKRKAGIRFVCRHHPLRPASVLAAQRFVAFPDVWAAPPHGIAHSGSRREPRGVGRFASHRFLIHVCPDSQRQELPQQTDLQTTMWQFSQHQRQSL